MSWNHVGYAQRLVFGAGALRELPALLRDIGAGRVVLVTTAGRAASADGEAVRRAIGPSLAETFDGVESHVPANRVMEAVVLARQVAADALVSFGGGSCADLAKAVNHFVEQERGLPGTTWLDRPALPHVAIPTTYSGAEVTPFFGMSDPQTKVKSGGGGPTCAPVAVVYDPNLTRSTPARVSAETGMNALAHCVEVAWSPNRTPEAEALALAGARRIHGVLPLVVDDPDDVATRGAMLEGAAIAGRCLQNASMGVHHGLSQLVGARTGLPHGLANAVILAHAIRFNAEAVPDAIARLGDALGVDDPAAAVDALRARIGLPATLSECGVTIEDLEAVAEHAPQNRNVAANPRPVSAADARALLFAAL